VQHQFRQRSIGPAIEKSIISPAYSEANNASLRFNGCLLLLNPSPNQPATSLDQGGKLADDYVFYWQPRDWREAERVSMEILDKYLPRETRAPFIRFLFEYIMALLHTLNERTEKGELTLLQGIKALNASGEYLAEQAKRHVAQLNENLIRAKAEDDALLRTVATGLGVVATAAAAVAIADANYRIANAETARAAAAQAQALAPIRCTYTLPGRYGSPGYVYCH